MLGAMIQKETIFDHGELWPLEFKSCIHKNAKP